MKRLLFYILIVLNSVTAFAERSNDELPVQKSDRQELKGFTASPEDNAPNSKVDPRVYYPRQVSRYERPTTGGDVLFEYFEGASLFFSPFYITSVPLSTEGLRFTEKLYIRLNIFRI